jgi:hypothetical protein
MSLIPMTYPTFAQELLAARAALTLPDEVGLAVRADRRRLRLSQRAYARRRGWPLSRVARLEAAAGGMKLGEVATALEGTPFVLALCRRPDGSGPPDDASDGAAALPVPVTPPDWDRTELIARVRGDRRRFPAHHDTEQTDYPPTWWWYAESTRAGTVAPHWYAPRQRPTA